MSKQKTVDLLLQLAAELEGKEEAPKKSYQEGQMAKVLEYIKSNAGSTSGEISKALGFHISTFYNLATPLRQSGKVIVIGKYPKRYYIEGTFSDEQVQEMNGNNDYKERILQFVSDNMGKTYSVSEMAKALNIPYGSMGRPIEELKKRKLLPERFNQGTEPLNKKATPKKAVKAPVRNTDLDKISFLIWQYVKEKRDVNLLDFLTWLEQR